MVVLSKTCLYAQFPTDSQPHYPQQTFQLGLLQFLYGSLSYIGPQLAPLLISFCKVLWVHITAATTSNIRCVSVDRFIAIQFPFRYQDLVTRKRCYPAITLMWLFSLIIPFSLLPVDHSRLFDKERKIFLLQCCRFIQLQQHLLFRYLFSHIHTFVFLNYQKNIFTE